MKRLYAVKAALLQLSHIHMNVETIFGKGTEAYDKMLQLSHIHMNVETLGEYLDIVIPQIASIEPHSYECGNY